MRYHSSCQDCGAEIHLEINEWPRRKRTVDTETIFEPYQDHIAQLTMENYRLKELLQQCDAALMMWLSFELGDKEFITMRETLSRRARDQIKKEFVATAPHGKDER